MVVAHFLIFLLFRRSFNLMSISISNCGRIWIFIIKLHKSKWKSNHWPETIQCHLLTGGFLTRYKQCNLLKRKNHLRSKTRISSNEYHQYKNKFTMNTLGFTYFVEQIQQLPNSRNLLLYYTVDCITQWIILKGHHNNI